MTARTATGSDSPGGRLQAQKPTPGGSIGRGCRREEPARDTAADVAARADSASGSCLKPVARRNSRRTKHSRSVVADDARPTRLAARFGLRIAPAGSRATSPYPPYQNPQPGGHGPMIPAGEPCSPSHRAMIAVHREPSPFR